MFSVHVCHAIVSWYSLPTQVNITHEWKTPLQMACYEGHVDVVKFLLENKADVNAADDEGDTALHYSAFG